MNNYSILIRGDGWIDRWARIQPHPYYPESDFNAWPTSDAEKAIRFKTFQEADAKARELTDLFGKSESGFERYRFHVIECRMVPRWFLTSPKSEREKHPVGSMEQL
jgi:hypothetical protein